MVDMGQMPEPKLATGATLDHAKKALEYAHNNSNICMDTFADELETVECAVDNITKAAMLAELTGEYPYMVGQYAAIAVMLCSLGMERNEDGDVYWDCLDCGNFHLSPLPPLTCPTEAS